MAEKEFENLKTYGTEFQNKCLAALLSDRQFTERMVDIISPKYFETSAQQWVVEETVKYFMEFKDIPTPVVMQVKVRDIDDGMKLLKQSVGDLLGIVFGHQLDSDLNFVKNQFLQFCQHRTLAAAIYRSAELLNMDQYDEIKTVIDQALKAGMERNLGHNYLKDIDKRMSMMARDCIKTKWENIDQLLDGGLGKGELGFFVAPAGSGKTWCLTRIGAEAVKQGKNVCHVTLELNENYVGLRYDACFSGIAFQDVRNHVDTIKAKLSTLPGQIFIKYFPLKTISPAGIKMFVERLQMLEQVKIDLLIVDYADILRPLVQDRNANSYSEAGSVYEELRTVAGELQIPVWSASQTNRSGHEMDVVQAGNVADSYRKIMTGDIILSLSRKMDDKEKGVGRIHVMKNRFGPDGLTFPCKFDTSIGKIDVYDPKSSDGMELLDDMDIKKKEGGKGDPDAHQFLIQQFPHLRK